MKRYISLIIVLALIAACFASCGETGSTSSADNSSNPAGSGTAVKDTSIMDTVLSPTEYILYQNIFYNNTGDSYVGQRLTKDGIFTTIYDSYGGGIVRYYVWGYNDQTKCCDWQWEFEPADPSSLPPVGSRVEMTGTFTKNDAALDGYWFTGASVSVKTEYTGKTYDFDLSTMSGTLERVQLLNVDAFPADYEKKTVCAYGRVAGPSTFQDPYYDGSWTHGFESPDDLPAIGVMILLDGVFAGGNICECRITPTTLY